MAEGYTRSDALTELHQQAADYEAQGIDPGLTHAQIDAVAQINDSRAFNEVLLDETDVMPNMSDLPLGGLYSLYPDITPGDLTIKCVPYALRLSRLNAIQPTTTARHLTHFLTQSPLPHTVDLGTVKGSIVLAVGDRDLSEFSSRVFAALECRLGYSSEGVPGAYSVLLVPTILHAAAARINTFMSKQLREQGRITVAKQYLALHNRTTRNRTMAAIALKLLYESYVALEAQHGNPNLQQVEYN